MERNDDGFGPTFWLITIGIHTGLCAGIGMAAFWDDRPWLAVPILSLLFISLSAGGVELLPRGRPGSYCHANLAMIIAGAAAIAAALLLNGLAFGLPTAGVAVWLLAYTVFRLIMANIT